MTTTKKALKFNGKKSGNYDFVYCTTRDKSIDQVQKYLESMGWSNLEYVSLSEPNGYETYHC